MELDRREEQKPATRPTVATPAALAKAAPPATVITPSLPCRASLAASGRAATDSPGPAARPSLLARPSLGPVSGLGTTGQAALRPGRPTANLPPLVFAPAPPVDAEGYANLTREVRSLLGFDLAQYKAPQVWRRVNGFAQTRGFAGVPEMLEACRTNVALRTAFRDMITINVSEFFRNAEAWETLGARILPELFDGRGTFRAWSAGCSLGYEPVSLAIALRELWPSAPARIVATDIDETILAQARASRYSDAQMVGVSTARRSRFFRQEGDAWEVRPEIRAMMTFKRHDLLRDPAEAGFDLVICRNVVIYFTETAKSALYERFARALRRDGVLFIGATESISNPREAGLTAISPGFYRRAS